MLFRLYHLVRLKFDKRYLEKCAREAWVNDPEFRKMVIEELQKLAKSGKYKDMHPTDKSFCQFMWLQHEGPPLEPLLS